MAMVEVVMSSSSKKEKEELQGSRVGSFSLGIIMVNAIDKLNIRFHHAHPKSAYNSDLSKTRRVLRGR